MRRETLTYALGTCTLGTVLVATSGIGVCATAIGDDTSSLERTLATWFPNATLQRDAHGEYDSVLAAAIHVVDGDENPSSLTLDVRGTAFQQRVWRALLDVPAGTTVTYTELARRIGEPPTKARAVGAANAANRIAVAIPCHRVVGTDGSLTGYRWGIDRKRALLERERLTATRDVDALGANR